MTAETRRATRRSRLGLALVAVAAAVAVALVSPTGVSAEPEAELRKRVVALEAEVLRLDGIARDHREWLEGLSLEVAYAETFLVRHDRRLIRCVRHALADREQRARRCLNRVVR